MSILAGEKFELKLLPLEGILLHEECEDNRSTRLIERFKSENVLLNPLIVGRVADKFILLDGANRFEALKKLECRSILAQVVDYTSDKVALKTWFHFVNEMTFEELHSILPAGVFETGANIGGDAGQYIRVISDVNESRYIKLPAELEKRLELFAVINRFYETNFSYIRIDSDTDVSDISGLSAGKGLLFIYPPLIKDDIIKISGFKQKLPAGISRHLIPNRVLHIKFLLDALSSDENLDKKNIELEKYIQYKIDTNKVRLYREPILIFDE